MTDIIKWHKENGGHADNGLAPHALRLLREAVELCIASGASNYAIDIAVGAETIKATKHNVWKLDLDEIPGEIADVSFLLEVFANHAGFNIDHERDRKFEILSTREYKVDGNGVLWRK